MDATIDAANEPSNSWNSTQVYVLAIVCLLVGCIAGYLLRLPKKAAADMSQALAGATDASVSAPTGDQMKRMADGSAQPLLTKLQKDPNNAEVLANLGSVYFRTQQFPLAVEYYERAVKTKPSAEGYVSLSNAYHYAGLDDKAFEALNSALQIDPKSANALFNLGMLDWQVKSDPRAAINEWRRLLKANPNHPRRAQVENMIAKAKKHMDLASQTNSR